jgi:lipoate-protein ligase B
MAELVTFTQRPATIDEEMALRVCRLGRVAYAEALAEQRRLQAARIAGEIPDTLLLLEHPHVYTLGRRSDARHILMSEAYLRVQGATVEHNERGGEVTYHGPGQLMAYPIIQLRAHERSIAGLVDRLEETLIRTLGDFAIAARRDPSDRGVWVGARKIASIGMALRRWVSIHGTALNVAPDLRYFTYINPCGHRDLAMTSMAVELGAAPDLARVADVFARQFTLVFGRVPLPRDEE